MKFDICSIMLCLANMRWEAYFFSLILSYNNSNINAVNPLQDNGGQNSTDFCIRFIAACTVKEIIILFFRLETEKAAMQTELEDTKSQLESFKRY